MQMRKIYGGLSQNQPRAQETPLFMWLDGQEGYRLRRDSVRLGERRELAPLSLQDIAEARGTAVAVTKRVQQVLERQSPAMHRMKNGRKTTKN